jgi:hypothetical protein
MSGRVFLGFFLYSTARLMKCAKKFFLWPMEKPPKQSVTAATGFLTKPPINCPIVFFIFVFRLHWGIVVFCGVCVLPHSIHPNSKWGGGRSQPMVVRKQFQTKKLMTVVTT